MGRAIALNKRIVTEATPEGLLRLVADELPNFNDVNVSTAFSTFNKLRGSKSFPRNIAADDGFRGLMALARTMCADGRLDLQAVANIVHAVAKMSAAGKLATADSGVQDTLAALEQRVVRVASDMEPQGVSNTVYSFAVLGRQPGAETRAALEAAVVRESPDMVPQAVANTAWSYATLGLMPRAKARAALQAAVARVGPGMVPRAVANTAWSFATLGLMPGVEARVALEVAVVRVGPGMVPQAVANTAWSFATLRLMPGAEARAALQAAVVRVGPGMVRQAAANTAWSFATLGLMPGAEAQAALEAAVVRTSPSMKPHELVNTLWSLLTLAATRDVPLPACYPSLWRAAGGLDVGSFKDVERIMMFHASMMHTELVSRDVLEEVTFPPWIMHEAREAWMRNAREDATVPTWVKDVASIIDELGVRCEVECLSECSKFSIDVYLPVDEVAIEFDGPTHFINTSDGGKEGAPGDASRTTTKTPSTELRDMFLRRRYRTVLSVPYYEWDALKGSAARSAYVVEKLRAVGVSIPAAP